MHPASQSTCRGTVSKKEFTLEDVGKIQITAQLGVRIDDGVSPRVLAPVSLNLEVPTLHCLSTSLQNTGEIFSKYIT